MITGNNRPMTTGEAVAYFIAGIMTGLIFIILHERGIL